MEKKEIAEQFMNVFKKYLHISSFYAKDHPLFLKAVGDFKSEIDPFWKSIDCMRIGVTAGALVVDETSYTKPQYQELARRLHIRRIKAIEIRKGITSMELSVLLNIASVPAHTLRKKGGLTQFFKKEASGHLSIEELDYSVLLQAGSGEYKDIWTYLLSDAVESKDAYQSHELADGFGKMMGYFSLKEFLENDVLKGNIHKFFDYLKEFGKEKFASCLGELTKHLAKGSIDVSPPDLEKIKAFFDRFDPKDIASMLIDQFTKTEEFDPVTFTLFSKIIEPSRHEEIAAHTEQVLEGVPADSKQKIITRLQKLFSVPDTSSVSEIYRKTLAGYLKNISFEKTFSIDRQHTQGNYRLILLNIFSLHQSPERLEGIVAALTKEFRQFSKHIDLAYLEMLVEAIQRKKNEAPQAASHFAELEKDVAVFVENSIWDDNLPERLNSLTDYLEASALGVDAYMYKIFTDNTVNPLIMKLFLKFFPESLPLFYSKLDTRYADIELIENMVEGLRVVDSPRALDVLEHIYLFSNNYVKTETLRAMRQMTSFDGPFLLSSLQDADAFTKKEVLLVINRDAAVQKEAFEKLFFMKNPWGMKNKVILENIAVVEELGLKDAREYLLVLSKRFVLWSWSVQRKAREVLRQWNS